MNKIDILICTLESRRDSFEFVYQKLVSQIQNEGLQKDIKIRYYRDERQAPIGFKRNSLIQRSYAKYVCFVDDDDDISDKYISLINEGANSDKDCASFNGIITFNGANPRKFIHSLKYNSYFEHNNIYYRPPNHLNLIKRELINKNIFMNTSYGEDLDWAMRLCHSKVLKTEFEIKDILYHYKYDGKYHK